MRWGAKHSPLFQRWRVVGPPLEKYTHDAPSGLPGCNRHFKYYVSAADESFRSHERNRCEGNLKFVWMCLGIRREVKISPLRPPMRMHEPVLTSPMNVIAWGTPFSQGKGRWGAKHSPNYRIVGLRSVPPGFPRTNILRTLQTKVWLLNKLNFRERAGYPSA